MPKKETSGQLVVMGDIAVDATAFPALHRALARGHELVAKEKGEWGRVVELRRLGQGHAAEKLVRDLLGVRGEPMPDDVKAALRAKREAMTPEEKQAEKEKRKADRILKRLAARRPSATTENTNTEMDAMAKKKTAAKVKAEKAEPKTKPEPKAKAPKVRDPRLPAPGSKLTKSYKGKEIEVQVGENDFTFEGQTYPSLTALALKITGAKAISGPFFFGLTKPLTAETK